MSEPNSLHWFGRRIAVSIKQRVGKVCTVQAPRGLEPFHCCKQPGLKQPVSVWSPTAESTRCVGSAPLCQGAYSALWFSFDCWLGPTIPTPGTALKLRQGVYPSTTTFCFTGDQDSTLIAGSVFCFSSEYQTLVEMWRLERWISCPLHSLPHNALLRSMGLPKYQLSFGVAWVSTKIF